MNRAGKMLMLVFALSTTLAAFGQSAPPPDGMKERTDLRNVRYCEILVVHFNAGAITADVYNTLGLNSCPADQWTALDVDKLAKQFDAVRIILNGPRYFTMDRNALRNPGKVENFQGLDARLLAQLEIKRQDRAPYSENPVERDTQYVYDQGKNVYELVSPDGHVYIMQSYSQEVEHSLDEQGLETLAGRLKLPAGWNYRVRQLGADLVVRNSGGKAYVVQDDLKNTYQRMD